MHRHLSGLHRRHQVLKIQLKQILITGILLTACTFLFTGVLYVKYRNLRYYSLNSKSFSFNRGDTESSFEILKSSYRCNFGFVRCFPDNNPGLIFAVILSVEIALFLYIFRAGRAKKYKRYVLTISVIIAGSMYFASFLLPEVLISELNETAKWNIKQKTERLLDPDIRHTESIKDTVSDIVLKLDAQSEIPVYFDQNPESEALFKMLNIKQGESDTFYRAVVLSRTALNSWSRAFGKSFKPEALLFPDHTLIVFRYDNTTIQDLAPALAGLLIRNFLENKDNILKSLPKISVLNFRDYKSKVKSEEDRIKTEITQQMDKVKAYITLAEDNITHIGSRENGSEVLNLWTKYKNDAQEAYSKLENALNDLSNNPIPVDRQAGIFSYPSTIYIKYEPDEKEPFSRYVSTVLHESLHFVSAQPKKELPDALEEGLTDFFTSEMMKILTKNNLPVKSQDSFAGYPALVRIVKLLQAVISREYLIKVYMTKNTDSLKAVLDSKFRSGMYDDFIRLYDRVYINSLASKEDLEEVTIEAEKLFRIRYSDLN